MIKNNNKMIKKFKNLILYKKFNFKILLFKIVRQMKFY